ncbi:MAG: hypothetical protein GQ534_08540, partial [Candidatus Delongbacteria bacterium]|nr:hypothetical protein [Candidatus Delongbacteria bacterium]
MKKIITIIFLMLQIVVFSGIKSLPSETVGFSTTSCDSMAGMDYHYISIPFAAEGDSSHHLNPDGDKFHNIWRWNETYQGWSGASYFPYFDWGWISSFPIYAGESYLIAALQTNFDFTTNGVYEEIPPYELITTDGNDMNLIMVPLTKSDLTMAGSGLGNDIGSCSQVVKWNPELQLSRVTTYNGLSWNWDFPISIGDPIYVNMTDSVTWPYENTKYQSNRNKDVEFTEINLPKSLYYRVVNSTKEDYDFTGKIDDITFKAWISGREDDIITESTYGCGLMQVADTHSTVYINLGNFDNRWEPGDIVNLVVTDQSSKDPDNWMEGKGDYKLKNNADAVYRGFKPKIKDSGEPIVLDGTTGIESNIPYETKLYQNYPNPFNPTTTIKFSLKDESMVNLNVYNYSGQLVKSLANEIRERGFHKIE